MGKSHEKINLCLFGRQPHNIKKSEHEFYAVVYKKHGATNILACWDCEPVGGYIDIVNPATRTPHILWFITIAVCISDEFCLYFYIYLEQVQKQ